MDSGIAAAMEIFLKTPFPLVALMFLIHHQGYNTYLRIFHHERHDMEPGVAAAIEIFFTFSLPQAALMVLFHHENYMLGGLLLFVASLADAFYGTLYATTPVLQVGLTQMTLENRRC